MKVKILIALAVLVGAGASAAVVGALPTSRDRRVERFNHMSNLGTPVAVSERNADILQNGGGEPALNELGTRAGQTFYVSPGAAGGSCYSIGPTSTRGLAMLACLKPGQFPSADAPILDMSGVSADSQTRSITFLELGGVAADGVASVALIDTHGAVHSAPVSENIYYADIPHVEAKALVAIDGDGQQIYRRPIGN
jgi:hypothetical protein